MHEWHQRLEKVVQKQGDHTEHVFWLSKYLANIWQNNYINLIIWNTSYATRGSHFLWPTLYIKVAGILTRSSSIIIPCASIATSTKV